MYLRETEGPNRRGRPLGRWIYRIGEYMIEKSIGRGEGLEQAKRAREKWSLFCCGHPLGEAPRESVVLEAIDYIQIHD